MKKTFPLILITAVVAGGLGFWGGMAYQTSKAGAAGAQGGAAGQYNGNGGFGGRGGRGAGGGFVSGTVLSKDAQSITVQPRSGGSTIIFYTPSTTVTKPTDVTMDAVSTGDNVTVMGTANSDGSVTAQSVQVRPAGMPGPGGAMVPQGQQPSTNTNATAPTTK